MTFPLNEDELNFVLKLPSCFETNEAQFPGVLYQTYYDIFSLMEEREIILEDIMFSDNDENRSFQLIGDVKGFATWVQRENEKAKRMSRREWKIAVIAAIIGAVAGQLPAIIKAIGGL